MKIWIHQNGIQQGPYDFDQLAAMGIDPQTPVWYDGLPKWTPASVAPATAPLFAQNTTQMQQPVQPQQPTSPQQQFAPQQQAAQPQQQTPQIIYVQVPQQQAPQPQPQPKQPATYTGLAVVLTIFCCSIFALVAIFTGIMSSSRYDSGDYAGAKKMSEITEWLLIISVAAAFITVPMGYIWFF